MQKEKIIEDGIEYTVHTNVVTGSSQYRHHDKLHRINGPAVECDNGTKIWYLNGILHREDGPAIERKNGERSWYKHGKHHREDGPAIISSDGSTEWYENGLRHRLDGPACEYINDGVSYFIHGRHLTEAEYKVEMRKRKLRLLEVYV